VGWNVSPWSGHYDTAGSTRKENWPGRSAGYRQLLIEARKTFQQHANKQAD